MKKNALILFAKTPLPGYSKTRLINPFSAEQAAGFYAASLKDVFNTIKESIHFDILLFIAPENFDKKQFPLPLQPGKYFFQQGVDLGIRMRKAFQFIFGKGYEKAAIIGSDFPHISESIILTAFINLKKYDCVLGPAKDGGYYLIGLRELHKSIFEDISWSTGKVYKQTVEKAEKNNISIKNLEMYYDVDTVEEMKQLYIDINGMDASLINFPSNVWQFLQKNKNTFL
jgi:rSAM/selenodomain-associated transferase 1